MPNEMEVSKVSPKEVEEDKEVTWDNKYQYLLTTIGFAVGLGNIWRFPYLCQIYGGGAFLIPYVLALVLEGIPLLYLEMAVGQRMRKGSIGVWTSISPLLAGVGISSMLVSFLVSLFYNAVLAWVLWYFSNSFRNPLPWSKCPHNASMTGLDAECVKSTPVNYFWYRRTLNITPNIETSGSLQWWLVLCLACTWFIIYLCFFKGIKSMGKAVYVTTTLPYVVLTIFLVRAVTLPGATDGLSYLFSPNWQILKNPQVWLDASTQIFFSLSVAFGGLIAFSSYNTKTNNCERDAILVGVINSITSLYASISIFAILGFKANIALKNCQDTNLLILMSEFGVKGSRYSYTSTLNCLEKTKPDRLHNLNLKPCDLKTFLDKSASGTGLAFIMFTQAVLEMPGSQVWAVLFFLMLFTLGLSSMFGLVEGVLSAIRDLKLVPKSIPNEAWTALFCFLAFLISLIFAQGSGSYWVGVFNSYVGSIPLLIIAFFEVIGVVYVHSMTNFSDDIYLMIGRRPHLYWQICWRFISPLMLLVVLLAYVALQATERPKYDTWNPAYELFPQPEVKSYPDAVFVFIVFLCVLPVIAIPVMAVYNWFKQRASRPDVTLYRFEMFETPVFGGGDH
ncbi:sodium-dependent neutral amino acid transporter B(0)AT3-like [Nerophis ophidion]|uniref:sodium-dependent neutral amino acid transporter B(0)AT3-like n=1 Tax=Nerophis ophidion TaxID=159077 RepID=UPI002AE01A26|nr:sodium-dependent neutral amino acid transporter B(0)AT3-like [Nerophis ophidion]